MIIEVVVARNHVGFNEMIFTKMYLTDRGTALKERRCSRHWCALLHMSGSCKPISSNSSCDKDMVTVTTICISYN